MMSISCSTAAGGPEMTRLFGRVVRDDPKRGLGDQGERVSQFASPSVCKRHHFDDHGLSRFAGTA
jgi:hypothetical protein